LQRFWSRKGEVKKHHAYMNPHFEFIVIALIFKDEKVLLGKRKGDIAASEMFQTPGGHVEIGESIIEAGIREIREEAEVEVENIRFAAISNLINFPPHHYVVISLIADWKSGEARVCEEDKCYDWGWYSLDALPSPLTPATADVIEAYRTGRVMFDSK